MKYSKMLKNNIFFEILQVAIGVRSIFSIQTDMDEVSGI